MKKILCVLLAVIIFVACFAGCGTNNNKNNENATENKVQAVKTPAHIAETFIDSLMSKNYVATLHSIGLNGSEFVTGEDIAWYLPRSDYKDILTLDFEKYEIQSEVVEQSTETAIVTVTVINKNDKDMFRQFDVVCALNENNNWFVKANDFYNTNYCFHASGGNTEVYINDIKVSDEYITSDNAGKHSVYKEYVIPYITRKDVVIKVVGDDFEWEQTITPTSNNKDNAFKAIARVSDNSREVEAVKSLFNRAVEIYESGAEISAYQEILSSDADLQLCEIIHNGIDSMSEKSGSDNKPKKENIRMTQCLNSTEKETYYLTDDLILVNFRYELSYSRSSGRVQTMHRNGSIILKYEDSNFKIFKLTDEKLFTWLNHYTDEW